MNDALSTWTMHHLRSAERINAEDAAASERLARQVSFRGKIRPEDKQERRREQKRRWMAEARARQKALDPARNWRSDEYQLTKFKRAAGDP